MQFNTGSYWWGCPNFEEYQEKWSTPPIEILVEDQEDKKPGESSKPNLECNENLEDEYELIRVPAITREDIEPHNEAIPGKNMVNYV